MKNILQRVYADSKESYYEELKNELKNNGKRFIITANPEIIMYSEKDKEILDMLMDKDVSIVPDGIAVVKAANKLGFKVKERITGVDIAEKLLEYSNELEKKVYLFGSKQEVIDSMINVIKEKYPKVDLVGATNGYVKDKDKIMKDLKKLQPDVVMVALGVPSQEKLIYKHLSQYSKGIFIGVGGSFDVISGMKKRAPKVFIKTNTEWLYRIVKEPKRLKRFWDNNIKFLFKVKNSDKTKKINLLFLFVLCLYLLSGFFMTAVGRKDVNYYENRTAYKLPNINLKSILNKEYQDNVEYAFSDQIPVATTMKKGYNYINNAISINIMRFTLSNSCSNSYINLGNGATVFGCDDNLVYYPRYIYHSEEDYEDRISSINKTLENTDVDTYIYYIEKDTDIDFENNNKTDIYSYLKENINSDKIYKYEINNFEEFKEYFYRTDHHWNYKGSYKAYTELVNILTSDDPLKYEEEICLNNDFSGSKASFSGASHFFKEEFCVYRFDFPSYDIYVNGEKDDYGNQEYHIENRDAMVSYGSFYGSDDGEIIFDNHDESKENILVIGESYDNAVLKLLASHFNKTFSIDLRNYEREVGKKFNYTDYLKNNNIQKVLLIGNIDYFVMEEFNLEV